MLYLLLAIVTSAMVSIFMRLSGDRVKNDIAMLAVSYLAATLISILYTDLGSFAAPGLGLAAAMAVTNGGFYVCNLILMQRSIPRSGVVLTSTYTRLGLIVTMALSVLLFRELPTALQLVGFALALGAILLTGGRSDGSRFRPGLLLVLLMNGIGDAWVKVFGTLSGGQGSDQFLMITFVVAALLCLGMMWRKQQRIGRWELLFGAAVAIPNYFNSRFLLKALQTLPGIIVYPTFSVGTLLLITVLGVCLFKERLTRRQWCAMGIILVSLALLNL